MTVRIITDSNGRKHITSEPLLHQPAPVMTDEKSRPVSFWVGKSVEPIAQPAPVQEPVAWFKHGPYEDGEQLSVVFKNPHDDICYSPLGFIDTPPAAQPAPVQPVWIQPDHLQKAQKAPFLCRVEPHKRDDFVPLHTTPPAAQPAVQEPVAKSFMVHLYNFGYKAGHHDTVEGRYIDICRQDMETYHLEDVSELLQDMVYTAAAQPAVPDALNPKDENPAYAAGWNDCRAETLKGMKP